MGNPSVICVPLADVDEAFVSPPTDHRSCNTPTGHCTRRFTPAWVHVPAEGEWPELWFCPHHAGELGVCPQGVSKS